MIEIISILKSIQKRLINNLFKETYTYVNMIIQDCKYVIVLVFMSIVCFNIREVVLMKTGDNYDTR